MSALFDFRSFVCVLLLTICTCTYIKLKAPSLFSQRTGFRGVFWKFARVGSGCDDKSPAPTGEGQGNSNFNVDEDGRVVFVMEDEFMDSPVGGLVSPFSKEGEGVSPMSTGASSRPPLKSALSTSAAMDVPKDDSCLKRNVSWADFSDGVAFDDGS
eukprot:jgi/Picre1/35878/NNA_003337.t1